MFDLRATTIEGHRVRTMAALIDNPDMARWAADFWRDNDELELSDEFFTALLRDLVGQEWLAELITLISRHPSDSQWC